MDRRSALRNAGLGLSSLIFMPQWAQAWSKENLNLHASFEPNTDALLAEIVETFIPETKTPGAKSLGVHQLIQKVVLDCYGKTEAETLQTRLQSMETLSKTQNPNGFIAMNPADRKTFLGSLSNHSDLEMKKLYEQLKNMSIMGYTSSEHYMVNIAGYEWAPNRYLGCVKLKK
jgi:hypothetical protein